MATATAAVAMTEIEGRGRSMVALRPLKGGEIVLRDSPIVLYSAFPFLPDNNNNGGYCSNCFISVSNQPQSAICTTCRSQFCTLDCQSMASTTSHTPWACQALARFRHYVISNQNVPLDLQIQARFLVSAYNLASVSPDRFRTLLSLQGTVSDDSDSVFLHSFVNSVSPNPLGFSLEMTRALLAKDKVNAFGLMEPFSEDREERSVRAYGIYPIASFFNHDCLPNACRFDYIDAGTSSNTDMTIRMIHDVPEGREICLSYFPVNLKYAERQKRLREDYGFDCDCDRCKVEANWSDCDEEDDGLDVDNENKNEEESMEEDGDEEMEGGDGDGDGDEMKGGGEEDFPHAYFFLTYMCDRKNCWGTLAPVAESVAVMECNVCGSCKNLDQV